MTETKKTTKKKTTKSTKKTQKVPSRKTAEPVVLQPASEEIKQQGELPSATTLSPPIPVSIPVENPVAPPTTPPPPVEEPVQPLFNDIPELQYAFDYFKYCSEKAGLGMEGVTFHNHDFAHFIKIAIIAIQRTHVANLKHMELEALKRLLNK